MSTPISPVVDGRGPSGRFGPGNKAAKGNPFAKRVARLRSALFTAVTPADLRQVVSALLAQAKAGEVAAAKELLNRLLGPPEAVDFAQRLEDLERSIDELRKGRGTSW